MQGKPIVWSISGNDSGGGAGLAADLRAALAFDVHLCPAVATLTAQNSVQVAVVVPVDADLLDAQLAALASDLPPQGIKTGLLGSAENVAVVARWVDRLRERASVALVVDPVLGASSGAVFADDAVLRAYRQLLLPRATLVTPNEREARRLLGAGESHASELAQGLRAMGAESVAVTGGDSRVATRLVLDWIATPEAEGWLALPRFDTSHNHGTGCTFATSAASALARGFPPIDALVLAKTATAHALRKGYAAGQGAGPVAANAGFGLEVERMPRFSSELGPIFPDGWPSGAGMSECASAAGAPAASQGTARLRESMLGWRARWLGGLGDRS